MDPFQRTGLKSKARASPHSLTISLPQEHPHRHRTTSPTHTDTLDSDCSLESKRKRSPLLDKIKASYSPKVTVVARAIVPDSPRKQRPSTEYSWQDCSWPFHPSRDSARSGTKARQSPHILPVSNAQKPSSGSLTRLPVQFRRTRSLTVSQTLRSLQPAREKIPPPLHESALNCPY